jgi:hypothetical protein
MSDPQAERIRRYMREHSRLSSESDWEPPHVATHVVSTLEPAVRELLGTTIAYLEVQGERYAALRADLEGLLADMQHDGFIYKTSVYWADRLAALLEKHVEPR